MTSALQVAHALCPPGKKPVRQGDGYMTFCPCHDDKERSLWVVDGEKGGVVPHCFTNCERDKILREFKERGFVEDRNSRNARKKVVRQVDQRYERLDGTLAYINWRIEYDDGSKKCYIGDVDGNAHSLGEERVLYRGKEVMQAAREGSRVFFVEGEKCVEALRDRGFPATTIFGGAKGVEKGWRDDFTKVFQGVSEVVILPDNDPGGKSFAKTVWRYLREAEIPARILELPKLPTKGDIVDFFAMGRSKEEFIMLVGEVQKCQIAITELETDMANADFFCKRNENKLLHVSGVSQKGWMFFNGKYWEVDERGEHMELAKATAIALGREAEKLPPEMRSDFRKWAKKTCNLDRLRSMCESAKTDPRLSARIDEFDQSPLVLVCGNGVLNIEDGSMRKFSPEYKLSKATAVKYNPLASMSEWLKFLNTVLQGDEEMIAFLKRSIGYSITGLMHEERFWFLYGPSRTGKSTFLKCISNALGDYAGTCPNTVWMKNQNSDHINTLARYRADRFIWVGELEESDRIDEPKLKGWVGGDKVAARRLYSEPVEFYPVGKLWFGGNHQPKVSADDSVFRKMFVVPFDNRKIQDSVDPDLKDRLASEHLEAILAWCVEGYQDYLKYGLHANTPQRVVQATESYREDADLVGRFIEECCVRSAAGSVNSTSLYKGFCEFVEAQGHRVWTQTKFGREMSQRGFERKHTTRGKFYDGVMLRQED